MERLTRDFFARDTVQVAQELLGQTLVFGNISACILETEAYKGTNDPASHAYRGPTKRSKIMFELAGFSYVYLIYGLYHCLNFTTEQNNVPGAVLIRNIIINSQKKAVNGPGRLCKFLNINKQHNNIDITQDESFYLLSSTKKVFYTATPRIGISKAKNKLWRFVCT